MTMSAKDRGLLKRCGPNSTSVASSGISYHP